MKNSPLVSIILPTYDRAGLLPNAIESVLAQTYIHWELLVWDDGSTDETNGVVQSYTDPRIRYFFEENHGKSYALNQAIQRSQGAYLAFLDDDDQWTPKKLEIQMDILLPNPGIDLVFGNFLNINQQDQSEGLSFTQNAKGLAQLETQNIGDKACLVTAGWLQGIATANFIAFDTVILPRKILDHMGSFNQELKNGMDFEYWWRFGLSGLIPAFTEEVAMKRYKFPGSLSGRSLTSLENHIKLLDTCTSLSIQKGRPETIVYLQPMYRNAWHNRITVCAKAGDLQGMLGAFRRSLRYGFRPGALRLLLAGFMILGKEKLGLNIADKDSK